MKYPSAVSKLKITEDQWVVSLCRKYKRSLFSMYEAIKAEHAFILVEGLLLVSDPSDPSNITETALSWRFDLFENQLEKGKAYIESFERSGPIDKANKNISDLLKDDPVYTKSWNIKETIAQQLKKNVVKDQNKEPALAYCPLGSTSISNSNKGENCFTWSRKMLLELSKDDEGDNQIKEALEQNAMDWIIAQTSNYITPPNNNSTSCLTM